MAVVTFLAQICGWTHFHSGFLIDMIINSALEYLLVLLLILRSDQSSLKKFRVDQTDPLSFGPKFPEILVKWIAP